MPGLFNRTTNFVRTHTTEFAFALVFASVTVVCNAYHQADSISYLSEETKISCLVFAASFAGGFFAAFGLFRFYDSMSSQRKQASNLPPATLRRIFILGAIVLLVCWLPWMLAFFPASMAFDGVRQLQSFYGVIEWTAHHTVFTTLIMGLFTKIGYAITGSNALAVFAYMGAYCIFQSLVCAAVAKETARLSRSKAVAIGSIAFFAIVPFFGANAQTFWKDGLYLCFFVLFMLFLARCAGNNRRADESDDDNPVGGCLVGLAITGIAIALCRKEGLYIALAAVLFALIISPRLRKQLAAVSFAVAIVSLSWHNAIVPAMGIAPASSTEGLSFAFQQTARTIAYHPQSISEEQREALSACFENYDQLAALYNPDTSDPVKNAFVQDELDAYLRVYVEMTLQHPLYLVDSLASSTYGYFYLGDYISPYPPLVTFLDTALEPVFPYDYPTATEGLRSFMTEYAGTWLWTPPLVQLVSPAFYIWIAILCLFYLVRERNVRGFILIIPFALTVAVACLSPVDGYLRYTAGMVAAMPLLVAWCTTAGNKKSDTSEKLAELPTAQSGIFSL